jgi:hypothetical protein
MRNCHSSPGEQEYTHNQVARATQTTRIRRSYSEPPSVGFTKEDRETVGERVRGNEILRSRAGRQTSRLMTKRNDGKCTAFLVSSSSSFGEPDAVDSRG